MVSNAEIMFTSAGVAIGGSSSMLTVGEEGEAALRKQLSDLLGAKEIEVDELNLLYCYRFGLSIVEALTMIGFDGPLQDFAVKQKCFSMQNGRMAMAIATAVDEPQAKELEALSNVETDSTVDGEDDRGSHCESDSDVDVGRWRSVGGRVLTALALPCEDHDEADFNVGSWKEVSGRVAVALQSDDSDEEEDHHPDAAQWRNVAARISRTLNSLDSDDC